MQEAEVVDLANDGRGVARVDGKAVFIEGALPGERVRFRVIKRRKHRDEAGLVDVLRASPDRVAPCCAHFGICGGCSLQHLSAPAQLAAKQHQLLENLQRLLFRELAEPAPATKNAKDKRAEIKAAMRELKKISKRIGAAWPAGVSAVEAIREQRRDL